MNYPNKDWRNEVNWLYVRQFGVAHLIMWMFGFDITWFSTLGMLVGLTRKLLGIPALLIFAVSLIGTVPIFGKTTQKDYEGDRFILLSFCCSVEDICGYCLH